jgi:thiol peroxidase
VGQVIIMEERLGEAFEDAEQLTVIGRRLHPGGTAVHLSDLAGMVRLLSVVNSLERPVCQMVTRRWEALCAALPPDACIYTVSMDPPQMQARWQDRTGVLHQALSAHPSIQFGQDYGVWLREWHLLQRSVVVIDRTDRIVYVEYVADQMSEPDYTAAIQAVQQAAEQ